jgi:uncharacterized DUF497 family protein
MSSYMLTFEWDDANQDHIARHDVLPHEVEEALNGDTLEVDAYVVGVEQRYEDLGTTDSGRILFVVSTLRQNRLRVVTAYDATRIQKREFLAFHRSRYE